jgi:hypothetical protein
MMSCVDSRIWLSDVLRVVSKYEKQSSQHESALIAFLDVSRRSCCFTSEIVL